MNLQARNERVKEIERDLQMTVGKGDFLKALGIKPALEKLFANLFVLAKFGDEEVTINGVSYKKVPEHTIFEGDKMIFMVTPLGWWHLEKSLGKYLLCEWPKESQRFNLKDFIEGETTTALTFADMNNRDMLYLLIENLNDQYKFKESGPRPIQIPWRGQTMVTLIEKTLDLIEEEKQ